MMSEEYLVKTKSGIYYPIILEGGLVRKKKMKIIIPKGVADVRQISDEPNLGKAYIADPESKTVDKDNLKPGKIIVFSLGTQAGNTSKIDKVFKKVA